MLINSQINTISSSNILNSNDDDEDENEDFNNIKDLIDNEEKLEIKKK